jgi:hypothetical protein
MRSASPARSPRTYQAQRGTGEAASCTSRSATLASNRSGERVPRPPSGRAEECGDVFCLCQGSLYHSEWFPAPHDRGDGPGWCPLAGLLGVGC